jgi:putative endonuclease
MLLKALTRFISNCKRYFSLGARGERIACEYLKRKNYRIWKRNWRTPICKGELDIVCIDGATLVCVEVKTKIIKSNYHLKAFDNFNNSKQETLQKMFHRLMLKERGTLWRMSVKKTRIDLITIDKSINDLTTIKHLPSIAPPPPLPWVISTRKS